MIFLSLQNYSISPKYSHQYPKKCRSCPKLAYIPSFFPLFSTKSPFSFLFSFIFLISSFRHLFSFLSVISFLLFPSSPFFSFRHLFSFLFLISSFCHFFSSLSLFFSFSHLFLSFFSFSFLFSLSLFFRSFTSSPSPSCPFSSTARCGGACLVTVQSDSVALLPRVSFPPFLPSKTPSSLRFLPAKHPKTG